MAEPIAETTVIARTAGTLWRRILGGVLVFAPAMDEPLRVSQPGDVLWLLLDEPATLATVASSLAELYGIDPAIVATDIEPILRTWLDQGAIELSSGPDALTTGIGGGSR